MSNIFDNPEVYTVEFCIEQDLDNESMTEVRGKYEFCFTESGDIKSGTVEEVEQALYVYSLDEHGRRVGEPREYIVCTNVDELSDVVMSNIAEAAFQELLHQNIVQVASVHKLERI
jgi:hypothetical protein